MKDTRLWDYVLKVTFYDEYGQHPADDDEIRMANNAIQHN